MKQVWFLAWQSLRFNRLQSVILIFGLAVTLYLPLAVNGLVARYQAGLLQRAATTPLVAGGLGSRFDLVLHALYFRGRVPRLLKMADVDALRDTGYAQPIPLYARYTARRAPIVGTTLDYFTFRQLRLARGEQLLELGDCVLGAEAAAALDLAPGDRLMTDPENLFDIAGSYPVNLRVMGVLAPARSPDDGAVFVDLKTAWLIEGLAHGHSDITGTNADSSVVLSRNATNVTANAALVEFTAVTAENISSFHFHGNPADFPVSAVLPVAKDEKSAALLRGRYQGPEATVQILEARSVVEELLGFVFRIKRFFDANAALVAAATGLFLLLVVVLSLRLRRPEMDTMFRLGCARGLVARLVAAELAALGLASAALALIGREITLALVSLW
ncbi:MAG: ABC transporter permease [Limisphaerales bacterium]